MFFRRKRLKEQETVKSTPKEEFSLFGINDILHFIKREIGVDLFAKKGIIETRLKSFAQQNDLNSFKELHQAVQSNESLRQELINLLTVNETYFYREEKQLHEAVNFALDKSGRDVQILCAPCASGEEAYTLSMLIQESRRSNKSVRIIGVDINTEAIKKANQGYYSQRALHKLSDAWKEKYFTKEGNLYYIKKHLFHSVSFSKMNIFDSSFLNMGQFDIVFSRNMLIYFDEDFRLQATKRFAKLLKPDGRLYLGHADIVPPNDWLAKHGYGSSCYYTKS